MPTKDRPTPALKKLIGIGQQMSNILYNLKQDKAIEQRNLDSMDKLQTEWDAAVKAYLDSMTK